MKRSAIALGLVLGLLGANGRSEAQLNVGKAPRIMPSASSTCPAGKTCIRVRSSDDRPYFVKDATELAMTGGYDTVRDEGSALTVRTAINFIGAGVTCADNAGASRTDCTISGGGASTLQGAYDGGGAGPNIVLEDATRLGVAWRAYVGQTANLMQWRDSSSNIVSWMDSVGAPHVSLTAPLSPILGYTAHGDNAGTNVRAAFSATNDTAATVGTQVQVSPSSYYTSSGWDVDGAVAVPDEWNIYSKPVAGNTVTSQLLFTHKLGAGATTTYAALRDFGANGAALEILGPTSDGYLLGAGSLTMSRVDLNAYVSVGNNVVSVGSSTFRAGAGATTALGTTTFTWLGAEFVGFGIDTAGIPHWRAAGNQQTTVGAAGGASALPATPTTYVKVKKADGTILVIPAYDAS